MEGHGIFEISWPSLKPRAKQARVHNHHVSLRDRIKELTHLTHHAASKAVAEGAGGDKDTTSKAVAWAVLQHHGDSGGHHPAHGAAVRRPSRFKIEAQMRHELAHRSVVTAAAAAQWDAGSTLFDSFELHSLLRTLDDAAHTPPPQKAMTHGEDAASEMIVFTPASKSPTHAADVVTPPPPPPPQKRYNLTVNLKHAEPRRTSFDSHDKRRKSFDHPEMHRHHHSKWKSLLHTLHLDGAHHKSHTQVAPHDLEQRRHKKHGNSAHSQELYDGHFERNELAVSKDVNPPPDDHHHHHHHPILWKLGFKTGLFCRAGHATLGSDSESEDPHPHEPKHHGHRQSELRKAWSSLTHNLLHHHHHHESDDVRTLSRRNSRDEKARRMSSEQTELRKAWSSLTASLLPHHDQHHEGTRSRRSSRDEKVHHVDDEGAAARSRRNSRDEKVRRVSSEEGGLKTPRNSLDTVIVSMSVHN